MFTSCVLLNYSIKVSRTERIERKPLVRGGTSASLGCSEWDATVEAVSSPPAYTVLFPLQRT